MRSGDLRNRVRIDRAPKPWTPDAAGQPEPTWEEYATRWARRRPLLQREIAAGGQTVALSSVAYDLRSDSLTRAVTPDEQFRLYDIGRDEYADIVGVPPLERNDGMVTLVCQVRAEAQA